MTKIRRRELGESSHKDDLAHRIKNDIKASPDLGLLRCVQCGMCASTCPASRHSNYDSRVVIKRVLDNDETILDDEDIWNCFYCYNCQSICPVGNSVCEVNQILRQMAIDKKEGKEKIESFISFADSYIDRGLGVIPQEYRGQLSIDYGKHWDNLQEHLDEIRDELKLESMYLYPEAEDEIDQTLKAIGFKKRVDEVKKVRKQKQLGDE
ncbi:4Fe-4S dicluster domain-containing protein [Methanosphaera cuniculi]|uniref:Succinate dehydrogenase/fumarate reductase iron-sulfur subunit n=1 Tax=Methanosphaera cuniculi TaxID=1077256 RepID=A0A2V2BQV2_9EURY|nr:4Fe-4S dicluster domain-containing protein [Methanosphaera cuniculi]PWL07913.1 succinate dehydrogenase/fumarate reductase iron-sulfur subunit [Methanosphaera cuniculi]